MHIPDGFLDAKTVATTAVFAAAGVGVALRQARLQLPPRRVPLLGLTAAFVFAAQMLNFPVAGGTSGHLVGGTLAGVLLGPSGAVLALAAVLIVQCFVFADGGVLALGANIFNMGIVGGAGSYYIYHALRRALGGERGLLVAAAFAAWCSIVVSAIFVAAELVLSGMVTWSVGFPAMASVHMLIGIGEALITTLVIGAIMRVRPDLLEERVVPAPVRSYGEVLAFGLLISIGLAMFLSPFASEWPDGLERVAKTLGFAEQAVSQPLVPPPIPDYTVPGIDSAAWATALAGAVGTVVVFALAYALARVLVPKHEVEAGAASPRR
jgi:cobalt/nickel transport system permease protein